MVRVDPRRSVTELPFNVQTEAYFDPNTGTTIPSANYDPYALNAPVQLYATGIRNSFDHVWHSNRKLYVTGNGSGAGGNSPGNATSHPPVPALIRGPEERDYLLSVVKGGYYGHPNPVRGEIVVNGGNPTDKVDPGEYVDRSGLKGYPVGVKPDPNYRGYVFDFGYASQTSPLTHEQTDTTRASMGSSNTSPTRLVGSCAAGSS